MWSKEKNKKNSIFFKNAFETQKQTYSFCISCFISIKIHFKIILETSLFLYFCIYFHLLNQKYFFLHLFISQDSNY
jgi:hypothetical protein